MEGAPGDLAFFHSLETHRMKGWARLMRHLPADPRCAICNAPFAGLGGRIVRPLGFSPSRKNPRLCAECFERAPMGGVEMEVGILFADVRGFTTIAEHQAPGAVAGLLNRFYSTAVEVLCRHAIIDKLVGDQVMALYLPHVFPGDVTRHMLADARQLLEATGSWVELGIGLDLGTAHVGNVGAGQVKDFTAIGDVVNTAARLQSVARSGQIVASRRVAPGAMADGVSRSFDLKGKTEPVTALVITPPRAPAPAGA